MAPTAYPFEVETGPIRPPAEAQSLLVRVTRGCFWNKCHFCEHYSHTKSSRRSLEEIKQDIYALARYHQNYHIRSCFLQDGDAFILDTKSLVDILETISNLFPTIHQISSYARASSIARKSASEMKEIRGAGLNRLYCGMESGSDTILSQVRKGVTAKQLIQGGRLAKEADIEISEFILIGLGGKDLWQENAVETAHVLNEINPDFIRSRQLGVKDNTKLGESLRNGAYKLQSEKELYQEQQMLIENLGGITSRYTASDHAINLLMEIDGTLPDDKSAMLNVIKDYLDLEDQDQMNFTIGRRLGTYSNLASFNKASEKYYQVEQAIGQLRLRFQGRKMREICNHLRARMM